MKKTPIDTRKIIVKLLWWPLLKGELSVVRSPVAASSYYLLLVSYHRYKRNDSKKEKTNSKNVTNTFTIASTPALYQKTNKHTEPFCIRVA